jgi:hypothetical protein
MANKKYKLSFKDYDIAFEVCYKNSKFSRLILDKGTYNTRVWSNIPKLIPYNESEIKGIQKTFEGQIVYTEIAEKKQSLHQDCIDEYYTWFETKFAVKPKITQVEAVAMAQIAKYLKSNASTDGEALAVWGFILTKWDLLEEFYRKQTALRQINKNLQSIIIALKNGKSSNNLAENIRESF